ncbi:Tex family protein [Gillisia sp. CAL575]|uniref:Tex family protein n=1 Tax=Gillisia sp. CAL575 TaxID=985255 RepID=UPI0003A9319C|nr:Tex family protein [Gillisia sp. CAL575]
MKLLDFIKLEVNFPEKAIFNTVALLEDDATIPFIARYRKELTGNLDEVEIEKISNLRKAFLELEKRKLTVIKAIEGLQTMSDALLLKIHQANSLVILEDLYLPFKKKRKTKAEAAKEAGLESLAKIIMSQNGADIVLVSKKYISKDISSVNEAIEGAKNIIAEWISENPYVRKRLRKLFQNSSEIASRIVKAQKENPSAQKYNQYFDWNEPLQKIPSHRFLAILRAENEGFLKIKINVDQEEALHSISNVLHFKNTSATKYINEAIEDSYKRLLKPSFTNEVISEAKNRADEDAIQVFADNLEQLLLAPPLGNKRILALDPGFKSGCKLVCLDENGMLLHNETIYPHPPQKEMTMAIKKVKSLVNAYNIEAISIGNGTASRETEQFIKKVPLNKEVEVYVVNEAGASIYSASKIARDEFPNYDITVRGAVSIGRRLIDPLAELVKIDAKSIGVGQYQHDVDQTKLKEKLDAVVMTCVNRIGINVNSASKELLSYISGIGPVLAENIINYRSEKGSINSRKELLKVPRLGAKAYEQSAGFLRIKNAENPLDDSAVHPERYGLVNKIAKDAKIALHQIIGNKEILHKIQLENYVKEDLGLPTLNDIIKELEKPGVDPRSKIKVFQFDENVNTIKDLRTGMKLPGIVNNITNFGCFVDIGVKESGLIHISKLANEYISDVNSVVKLGQHLMVTVLEIDLDLKRIQLSLIG